MQYNELDEEEQRLIDEANKKQRDANDLWQTNNFAPDGGIPGGA